MSYPCTCGAFATSGNEHHITCPSYEPPLTKDEIRALRSLLRGRTQIGPGPCASALNKYGGGYYHCELRDGHTGLHEHGTCTWGTMKESM